MAAATRAAVGCARGHRVAGDLALVGLGKTVPAVLDAAERLAEQGVSAAVVDARFVKPLDVDLLVAVGRSCGAMITVEDHGLTGGFGSAVLEALAPRLPGLCIERLGLPDRFVEHGDVNDQWREVGLDGASIAERALRVARPSDVHSAGTQFPLVSDG